MLQRPPQTHRAACLNALVEWHVTTLDSDMPKTETFESVDEIVRDVNRRFEPMTRYEDEGCNRFYAQVFYACVDTPAVQRHGTHPVIGDADRLAELVRGCIETIEASKVYPSPGAIGEREWRDRQTSAKP